MGQPQNNTTTTSSAPTDPNVTSTVDQLLTGVQAANTAGPQVFNQSLYSPTGATTAAGQTQALAAADNPAYSSAVNSGINYDSSLMGANAGLDDPTYQALKATNANATQSALNQEFNNSGRLGGGLATTATAEGITQAGDAMDLQQYQQGIQNSLAGQAALPAAYQSALLPSATTSAVGAAQDANQQGILSGTADLFNRNATAKTNLLSTLSSILAGNAQVSGSTATTSTPATPWYQSVLSGVGALL